MAVRPPHKHDEQCLERARAVLDAKRQDTLIAFYHIAWMYHNLAGRRVVVTKDMLTKNKGEVLTLLHAQVASNSLAYPTPKVRKAQHRKSLAWRSWLAKKADVHCRTFAYPIMATSSRSKRRACT